MSIHRDLKINHNENGNFIVTYIVNGSKGIIEFSFEIPSDDRKKLAWTIHSKNIFSQDIIPYSLHMYSPLFKKESNNKSDFVNIDGQRYYIQSLDMELLF